MGFIVCCLLTLVLAHFDYEKADIIGLLFTSMKLTFVFLLKGFAEVPL